MWGGEQNATLENKTTGTDLIQSDIDLSTDPNTDQTLPANSNDTSIEVTMTATNNLKSDTGKKMILMGLSDYKQITSLKINAGPGVHLSQSDGFFINEQLTNLKKIDFSNVTEVEFPTYLLNHCENLQNVIFPDGAIINHGTFQSCYSLKSIDLSNVSPDFGNDLFYNCSSLESVILPYGAKISQSMFGNCTALKTMDLSNANSLIGNSAFVNCSSLQKVILPENTMLSGDTFNDCANLDDLNFEDITSFKGEGFWNSEIVRNCAFDFTQGYPVSSWTDAIVNQTNNGQVPKVYFSLEKSNYQINIGDSFTLPKPVFKTKSGTNYSDLEKYKKLYASWLDQDTSYLNKLTYKTTIVRDGQLVNSIDSSIPGNYEITYTLLSTTYADTHTLTCNVTVIDSGNPADPGDSGDQVTSIHLDQTNLTMTLGKQPVLLKATLEPESITNKTVSWSSSDKSVATVDETGKITAIKAGVSTITAMIDDCKAQCQVTVTASDVSASEVNISYIPNCLADFKVNDLIAKRSGNDVIFTLNYESTRAGGYSFFNPPNGSSIMKYDFSGIKTGTNTLVLKFPLDEFKKVLTNENITMKFWVDSEASASWIYFKTAQLSALASQGSSDNPPIEILPTTITLDKTSINLAVDNSEKITPSLTPSNTTNTAITWSSNSSDIATVDSNGNVKGIKEGSATITAMTSNNLTAKCTVIVKKSDAINTEPSITYQIHVQDVGWQDWKNNGDMSGTSGRSLRLEGIKIQLNNYENLGVEYQTHIQNIGWESDTERGWKSDGAMSGTQGLSYRLEAIQIKLTGTNADNYDIYYHVHAQNVGWMGWAKNGESAGTAGYGYRLEGIEIKVVPKGDPAPSNNVVYANPFKENIEAPYSPILQEYRVAEANGFSSDILKNLPNVNDELLNYKGNNGQLFYTVQDISGDSTPELLIGTYSSTATWGYSYGYKIYDIYRLSNGKPERIFDINSMGYRSLYTICENQMVKCYGSGGAKNYGYKFYKLDGNSATTYQEIEYSGAYGPKYYLTDAQNNARLITEEKANIIINSYIPRNDLKWIKL